MQTRRDTPKLTLSTILTILALVLILTPVTPGWSAVSADLQTVVTGLSPPTLLTHAGDGSVRLFIVEQEGRIKVLQPGAMIPTIFLDIRDRVRSGGERGLLGLAFHPQYVSNGRLFVNYTRTSGSGGLETVVAEYRVLAGDPDQGDAGSEAILITFGQPFQNHNGGMIEFGTDGFLYIGTGDGGSGNDPSNFAQNLESLLGKILRIDVDRPGLGQPYSSPADNPFVGASGRDEIFAYGLRNPWRFSFDRVTGRLYLGDVGQNAVEEVDIIIRGGNFGWRVLEGTRCTNLGPGSCTGDFVAPIAEYTNTGQGGRCSITGGYVYRGRRRSLPYGTYLYGDFCSGEIFAHINGASEVLLDTNLNIVSFGEDEEGELYVLGQGGSVHRIVHPQLTGVLPRYFPSLVATENNPAAIDGSEVTGFAVVNLEAPGSPEAELTFTAREGAGPLVSGPDIVNPSSLSLAGGEQLALVDTEIFGSGLRGAGNPGWVLMESTRERVAGFFLSFNESLTVLDGAAVAVTPWTEAVLPEVESEGFTRLHVGNPHSGVVEADIRLMANDGTIKQSVTRRIEPLGVLVESISALFPTATIVGSDHIRVRSREGLVAFEFFGKAGSFVQGVNGQDATSGATTVFSPQYVVGAGWRTVLTVINLDATAGSVTLELLGADGNRLANLRQMEIGARGKLYLDEQDFFLDPSAGLVEGYVVIRSNGIHLSGTVVFGDPARNRFSAALPLVTRLRREVVFSQVASDDVFFTGLAFMNPAGEDMMVQVQVCDASGNELGSGEVLVVARGRRSMLLTELLPQLLGISVTEGLIKVRFGRNAGAFGLYGTIDLSVLSAIEAQSTEGAF